MENAAACGEAGGSAAGPVAAMSARRDFATTFVVAALAALTVLVFLRAFANAGYPFALDDTETAVLNASRRAAQGAPFYRVIGEPPYVVTVYNPLAIVAGGAAMALFGSSFAAARMVALAFYIGSAAVVYLLVKRWTRENGAALAAALLFFVARHLWARAGHAVVDYQALFLSLLGLYLWTGGSKARAGALLAFALAFFTRQTALAAPAAALTWEFTAGRRRQAALASVSFVLLIGAGLVLCGLIFGKAYFVNAFVYVRGGRFLPAKALGQIARAVAFYAVPLAGAVALARRGVRTGTPKLPIVYTGLGLAASISVGMEGAGYGYLFDFVAGLAIVAGLLWASAVARIRERGLTAGVAAPAALGLILAAAGVWPEAKPFLASGDLASLSDRSAAQRARDAAIRAAYEETDGLILCREAAMEAGARGTSVGTDMYKVSQLIRTGRIPADALIRLVEKRALGLIIVPETDAGWTLYPADLRKSIEDNYYRAFESPGLAFYRPANGGA